MSERLLDVLGLAEGVGEVEGEVEGVGDADMLVVVEGVGVGVAEIVAVVVAVGLGLCELPGDGVMLGVGLGDGVELGVVDGDPVVDGVADADAVEVGGADDDGVGVGDGAVSWTDSGVSSFGIQLLNKSRTDAFVARFTEMVSPPLGDPEIDNASLQVLLFPSFVTVDIPVTEAVPPAELTSKASWSRNPPDGDVTDPEKDTMMSFVAASMDADVSANVDTTKCSVMVCSIV